MRMPLVLLAPLLLLAACLPATGEPECVTGMTACDGVCTATDADPANCGACGNHCAPTEACVGGACTGGCEAWEVACDGACIDPLSAAAHCGATGDCLGANAGARCADDAICVDGRCTTDCGTGLVACEGSCIDPASDPTHCGATRGCEGVNAGDVCGAGERCEAGRCAVDCGDLVRCDDACVDPATDRDRCGVRPGCVGGTACETPLRCLDGRCALSCGAGTLFCGDACVDPLTDDASCGATGDCIGPNEGRVCGEGRTCRDGGCPDCDPGYLACGEACIDPRFDLGRCGASGACTGDEAGQACGAGETCLSGGCTAAPTYLKASNTDTADRFGHALALDGSTLAVGAPMEDGAGRGVDARQSSNEGLNPGAVYVFERDAAGAWAQQAYLKASNTGAQDHFGASVALDGDTLVVGAPGEASALPFGTGDPWNDAADGAGAVYVFVRDAWGVWTQQAYLKASNPSVTTGFGASVAVEGDTLVVGAPGQDGAGHGVDGPQEVSGAPQSGAAYVFARDAEGAWTQEAYLKAGNAGDGDVFGWGVGVSGDRIVVSAPGESGSSSGVGGADDDALLGAGAVYAFYRSPARGWMQEAYVKASDPCRMCEFGAGLDLHGDVLAVGAPAAGGPAGGAAYVFRRSDLMGWQQETRLAAPNPWNRNALGTAVSLGEDALLVGAPGEDGEATGLGPPPPAGAIVPDRSTGAAYLFVRRADGAWSVQAYVKATNPGDNDGFASTVALSGSTLAAGAPEEESAATGVDGDDSDDSAFAAGAVYVY